MTIEQVKAERDALTADLQRVVAPPVEAFEAKTGVVAQVRVDHIDVTTIGESHKRYRVEARVVLDWECV